MSVSKFFLDLTLATGPGWVMYLLVFCSVLSFSIIIERLFFLKSVSQNYGNFLVHLLDKMNSGDSPESIKSWVDAQKLLEARVVSCGFKKNHRTLLSRQEGMTASLLEIKSQLERGLTILATLGAMAPFIGLFGTVIGIIEAFHALSIAQEGGGGMQLVMSGISEALVATALGIFVAIPAVVAYNTLQRVIRQKLMQGEGLLSTVISYFENQEGKSS